MSIALHHQNLRKRVYKNLEQYPSPNPGKRFLDKFIFVIGALGPLAAIPQAYSIFSQHTSAGVSLFTWFAYFLFAIVWLIYGIVHKEKILIFTYILWVVMDSIIVLGILTN